MSKKKMSPPPVDHAAKPHLITETEIRELRARREREQGAGARRNPRSLDSSAVKRYLGRNSTKKLKRG